MADQLSRVFAALADPTRRDLLARLSVADATVGQLAAPYDVTVQAGDEDWARLRAAWGPAVFDLMTQWIERYRLQAEERYRRLDAVLAAMDDAESTNRPRQESA